MIKTLSRLALAACLLSGLSATALADNTADEADLRFARGVEAYRARRYEDALAEFFSSNRLVKNRNVILNIARCYEQLSRFEEAYRYYNDVLGENPTAEDQRIVGEALKRLAPRVALVRIVTDPPGAEIYIDRKDLGSRGASPKTLALREGKTRVVVALAGYREASSEVALKTGQLVPVELPLELIYGEVELGGAPEGAEVRVDRTDGVPEGRVPGVLRITPGKHILNVSAPGHLPSQLPVEVAGDQKAQASIALQELPAPTGNLVVTANHEGALVTVDGKEAGFTPAVIELPVGEHRVAVTMAEMRPFEQQVAVKQGERSWVKAELRFAGVKTTAASKTETSIEEAPASISVITREEIQAFGYTSLPEALAAVRGMFFSNDRTYEYVGVRGFSPPGDLNSRILVLYDGHPMNDIYAGQAYIGRDNNVDLAEVERIEIVRGPVSSLFGSAAFFGVINVVPRHHLGDRAVEASAGAGTLGLTRARVSAGGKSDDAQAVGSIAVLNAAGDRIFVVPPLENGASETLVRNSDGELAVNGSARASWKGLSLLGSINSRSKQVPTGAFETLIGKAGTGVVDQRGFLEARFDRSWQGGAAFAARAYYDATRYRGTYQYEEGKQVERGGADWAGAELRYRTGLVLGQNLTAGLEYQRQISIYQRVYVPGGLDDDRAFDVASAYLADELRLGERLLVNGSVRADDYFGSFGLTVNPRLALILKTLPGGVTKLMGGRSFRAPTAYERFYHDGVVDPASGEMVYQSQKPNESLKPETILTAEVEHSQEVGDEVRLVGSVFVNRISDLIAIQVDPADDLMQYGNASGTVRTEGAEVELRWQPARLSMISAAYWYQRMDVSGIADPLEEARLRANMPAHAFSLRAMFPIQAPAIVGAAEAVYNSSRLLRDGSAESGEMLLLNAGLSGELPGGLFRYYAGVHNLLDEQARLPAGSDVPQLAVPSYGRTFLVQLSASY